ncbi:MAG: hypothetical protein JO190_12890 [Candidatus Eremiobacteraeota bacterium]|nr:hypothetical protein [Candidatus Eremiobacteraeota bacterium]MBV8500041.1 hypothetical protein [Candidatus Eremiobacteraeota bacterium]
MAVRKLAYVIAAVAWVGASAGRSAADLYTNLGVEAVLDQTPQLERAHLPGTEPSYRIKGTPYDGLVIPAAVLSKVLANRRGVLVVPLDSGGTGVSFVAPVWSGKGGDWHYAGYIASPRGHLRVFIEGGYIVTRMPVYAASDPECCPSASRVTRYTVDANELVAVDSALVAHGQDLPPWLYFEPGTRAFLHKEQRQGMPIVIEGVASNGYPCGHDTAIHARAADRSWSGYVSIDSVLPAIPAGTLLRWSGNVVRVVRFDAKPSGDFTDALVAYTAGPNAGTQRRVPLDQMVLRDVPLPVQMVCPNDARYLSLRD